MAVKVTKDQICSGTKSKIKCHKEYCLCGKFHTFLKRSVYFAVTSNGIIFVILPSLHDITQHWFLNAGR